MISDKIQSVRVKNSPHLGEQFDRSTISHNSYNFIVVIPYYTPRILINSFFTCEAFINKSLLNVPRATGQTTIANATQT